jgi:chromosome segregation ATPase
VETALETFLTTEKGRVKLSRPIHQMKSIIRRVYTEVIPARKALLTAELEQVEMRFAMDDKLAQLQSAIASGLTREINAIRTQVEWAIQQKQHEQAKIEEAHRTLEAAHQQASKLEKALDALAEEVTLA